MFGTAIARQLSERGAEVIAIDNNESKIEKIKDEVAYAVTMDSTNKKALLSQNLETLDAIVVAIGLNFEALLLTTVYLQEIGAKRIISRANSKQQHMILEKIGVTEILAPEHEVSKIVAERLLNPSVLSALQLPDTYEIVEIKPPPKVVNKTIRELGLRNNYRLNLVTIKREFEEKHDDQIVTEQHVLGVPNSSTTIYETDTLVMFGTVSDIERFIEVN